MAKTARILTLSDEAEANWMDAVLDSEGIPHMIRSFHDSAYDGLYQAQWGWGQIEAPEQFKDRILKLYEGRRET